MLIDAIFGGCNPNLKIDFPLPDGTTFKNDFMSKITLAWSYEGLQTQPTEIIEKIYTTYRRERVIPL